MAVTPGCIIPESEVKSRDPYGRYWVSGGEVKGYILKENIPAGWQLRRGNRIVNLVCLPRQHSQPLAISNYQTSLIQYFYGRKGRIVGEANKPDIWVPRWREGAGDPLQVSCLTNKEDVTLPPSPECRRWQFVSTAKWLMPIATSQYLDIFNGSPAFCPSALQKSAFLYLLPPSYTSELAGDLPISYQGLVHLPDESKPIRIYLHGFLQPLKWHHVIWEHMMSGTPTPYNKMEKAWWASWLGYSVPSDSEVFNIFEGCEEKNKHICRCCSQEQFRKIHEATRNLGKIQWNALVTLWESTSTKRVFIKQTTFGFWEVGLFVSQIQPVQCGKYQFYPILIFQGWSYDWDNVEGERILHINPSTFFLSESEYIYTPPFGFNYLEGELKNVKRA